MKPYNSIIHSVLIVALILFTIYLYIELQEANKLLSRVIPAMHPKQAEPDNSYGANGSILLTFIGVGFALFAFLTFQSVKDFFHSKIAEIKKKQKKENKHYKKHVHKLEELEDNWLSISSVVMGTLSDNAFKDGQDWLAVYYKLTSIRFFSKRKSIAGQDETIEDSAVENMLITLLSQTPNEIKIDQKTFDEINKMVYKIASTTNIKSSALLNEILGRFKIVET